ncbi:hypothetical protein M0813_19572 [Anaeramoeba flamelloides]|uniref:Uncharacterized protein n=1 Tax=Anaeramoeba flamelloides TaxID=1746091 RepID=A0ABQ8YNJ3_9EUKA|nr:hypothetical protein M0813_19572 [Anaeramoeba flamelloides]
MSRFLSDPFDQTSIDQFEREPSDVFERVSSAGYSMFTNEKTTAIQFVTKTLTGDQELSDIDFDISYDSDITFENALSRTASSKSQFNNDLSSNHHKNKKHFKKKKCFNDGYNDNEIYQPQSPINFDFTDSDSNTQPGSDSVTEPVSSSSSFSEGSLSDKEKNYFVNENLGPYSTNLGIGKADLRIGKNTRIEKGIENSEKEDGKKRKEKENDENEENEENENEKEKEKEQEKEKHNNTEIIQNYEKSFFVPLKHSIHEIDFQTHHNNQDTEKSKPKQIPMNANLPQNGIFEYSHGQLSFTRPTSPIDLSKLIESNLNLANKN